jgi:enamine deaminase RidA (YjgF/YER057c/UK114 family)
VARPEHVLKLTVFVVDHDMGKLGVLTRAVTGMFGTTLPAQTLIPVPKKRCCSKSRQPLR